MMQKGFNSDVLIQGNMYHIQTEDWGPDKGFIVTRVFRAGAVLKTLKTPYDLALKTGPINDSEAVKLALRRQHHKVIEDLQSPNI